MQAGARIGKYVLKEKLGAGGMAEVWAADAEGTEGFVKPVAIKFALHTGSREEAGERQFHTEASLAARLHHANLVTVFDFDRVDDDAPPLLAGRRYIVMERIQGFDLGTVLRACREAKRTVPETVVLYIAGEALKGLRYVHELGRGSMPIGLVHRDISPHNILASFFGEVKISDFGIAKALRDPAGDRTERGVLKGKVSYVSPEQIRGDDVDHRSDQFSFGVVLWELLSCRRLFTGASDAEILHKIVSGRIPSLREEMAGDVSPETETLVLRMLAPRPADRFPTTAAALTAVLGAPRYSGDSTQLGHLVCKLFPDRVPETVTSVPPASLAIAVGGVPILQPTWMTAPTAPLLPDLSGTVRLPVAAGGGSREDGPEPDESQTVALPPSLPLPLAPTRTRMEAPAAIPQPAAEETAPASSRAVSSGIEAEAGGAQGGQRLRLPVAVSALAGVVVLGLWLARGRPPRPVSEETTAAAPSTAAPSSAAARPAPPPDPIARAAAAPPPAVTPPSEPPARERIPDERTVGHPAATLRKAQTAFDRGDFRAALALGRQAARAGGGAGAWVIVGDATLKLELYDEAASAYRRALAADPVAHGAQEGLAATLRRGADDPE